MTKGLAFSVSEMVKSEQVLYNLVVQLVGALPRKHIRCGKGERDSKHLRLRIHIWELIPNEEF